MRLCILYICIKEKMFNLFCSLPLVNLLLTIRNAEQKKKLTIRNLFWLLNSLVFIFRNLVALLLFWMKLGILCTDSLHIFFNYFHWCSDSCMCLYYAVCFLDLHMKLLPKSCIRPSKITKGLASLNYHVVTSQFAIMQEM